MGIPAMFRWLSQKYPKIMSGVIEEKSKEINGEIMPVDRTKPNPNGEEFHNLYLDMNGIVHPCSHPEDKPAPKTEADMMLAIFEYTDRVVGMVRPRRLLYLAVDGVAPRAKMNQQRTRRFRAAKEAKEKDEEKAEFLKMLNSQKASRGEDITSLEEVVEKTWDSNAITPGTPFMHMLAESLQYWCAYKFTTDPSWRDLKVIISDASVPGEGEHKIMNFIRSQRAMRTHDPNTRHVIYGLDADLIMLGLATHEPHFRVLREDVFFDSGKDKACHRCGRKGHVQANCPHDNNGVKLTEAEAEEEWNATDHPPKPFLWLHVNVLREYLAVEMDAPGRTFEYNLERSLDDWVFMCFFVGNDFLPHLPSLEIRDQGIDMLLSIWRNLVPQMTDYITKDGYPDMKRVQQILQGLGEREAGIFQKRKQDNDRRDAMQAQREAQRNNRGASDGPPFKRVKEDTSTYLEAGVPFFEPQHAQSNAVRSVHQDMMANRDQSNKSAAAQLKELLNAKAEGSTENANAPESSTAPQTPVAPGTKRKVDALIEDSDSGTPGRSTPVIHDSPAKKEEQPPEDTVKLWEPGYEERYYEQKFGVAPDDVEFRHKVAREYARGLCWVLAYYMQGCPSWTWYFPYHYAPFATDFVDIENLDPRDFIRGKPFKPYEQLMGVLPAASNHTIPEPFRVLMSDPDSPIIDFYPEDFPLDLNGKKFAWQGVVILPFIDEKRLLDAMAQKYPELSDDEHKRNELGKETLMFSQGHALFEVINDAFYRNSTKKLELDPTKSHMLHGHVEPHDLFVVDSTLYAPFDTTGMDGNEFVVDGTQDRSIRMYYEMPELKAKVAHKSKILEGVIMPPTALSEDDQHFIRNRNARGGRGGYRGGFNNRGGRSSYQNGYGNGNGRGRGGYNGRGGHGGNPGSFHGGPPGPPPVHFPFPQPPLGLPPLPPGFNPQYPLPPPSHLPSYLPPPPPGWNPSAAQQFQRPGWLQTPPPNNAPPNSSLRNSSYYRPAEDILRPNGQPSSGVRNRDQEQDGDNQRRQRGYGQHSDPRR